MKKKLYEQYQVEVQSMIRKSDQVYLIIGKNGKYILKYVKNHMENLYRRLSLTTNDAFLLPLKSRDGKYVEYFEEKYFTLTPYLEEEAILSYDIRLSFFMKTIAKLHHSTLYPMRVGDQYFEETLNYFDQQIESLQNELDSRMERVEKEDYHSPADWFFLSNYHHFSLALKEASKHVNRFEEEWKKESDLSLCLTYQNFSFEHILPSHGKIIAIEKMAIAPCIYDLYDVFLHLKNETISLKPYLKDYLDIHPLKPFEQEWFFALLFLPPLERKKEDIEDIASLLNTLRYIKRSEEIATEFYNPSQTTKEQE